MTRTSQLLTFAVFALITGSITAMNAGERKVYPYCPEPWCRPLEKMPCGCPDDYCAKQIPCTRPLWCGTCDNYCSKCLPCTKPVNCGTCDTYCRKKGPIRFETCLPPWYTCGPRDCGP